MEDCLMPVPSWGHCPHQSVIKSSSGETPWKLYTMCRLIQNGGGLICLMLVPSLNINDSLLSCVSGHCQWTAHNSGAGKSRQRSELQESKHRADWSSVTMRVNGRSVTKDPECKTDRQTEKMTPHFPPLPSAMEPTAASWWHTKVPKWVGLPQNRKGRHTGTLILRSLCYLYTGQRHNNKEKTSDQFPWWT